MQRLTFKQALLVFFLFIITGRIRSHSLSGREADLTTVIQQGVQQMVSVTQTFPSVMTGAPDESELTVGRPSDSEQHE